MNFHDDDFNTMDYFAPPHNEAKRFKMSTSNDLEIVLTNNNPKTYHNCNVYDASPAQSGDFWHMIVIHHERRFKKPQILEALFELVSDSEFFPVSYTQSKLEDYFLLRLCRAAIDKLFANNLRCIIDNQIVYLTIKFQVAQFKLGQIYPSKKYSKAISERMHQLILCEGVNNVLNLDRFSCLPELEQICVNLANKMSLQLLFTLLDTMNTNQKIFERINGLRLSNNNICTLESATKIPNVSLEMIDLRNNNIRTVNELANLKRIKFKYLFLEGNPCVNNVGFRKEIQEMFPDLDKVDKMSLRSRTVAPFSVPRMKEQQHTAIEIANNNDILSYKDAEHNLRKFEKYKAIQNTVWHQIIVHHDGKHSQSEILDAIFEAIAPNDILPCYYKPEAKYDSFFVRDCYDSLESLYDKKLMLTSSSSISLPLTFKMSVAKIEAKHVNPTKLIESVIDSKYDLANKTLNLDRFAENEQLVDMICRISVPRTLTNILTYASRKFSNFQQGGSNIEKLSLSYNGLKSTRGMHPLLWMKALKEVDLSNNKIEDVKQIEPIPKATIDALWLEGNPLCLKYESPSTYMAAVKEIIKNLESLDGHEISKPLIMTIKQNFLCSLDGYDLAEQFVQHYFTVFDSAHRLRALRGIYNENSILTMSINSLGMPDSIAKRIAPIIDKCRNFKRVVASKTTQNAFLGPEKITSVLGIFNQTEHDFTTFTIDMTSYTPTRAVITVNGLFKESGNSLNEEDLILGFARTFIICKQAEKLGMFHASEEFQITNDIVLFYRPSTLQLKNSFKSIRSNVVQDDDDEITDDDKQGLEIIFHELTTIKGIWCKKFLSTATWNLREALESFIELSRDNKIPPNAFS